MDDAEHHLLRVGVVEDPAGEQLQHLVVATLPVEGLGKRSPPPPRRRRGRAPPAPGPRTARRRRTDGRAAPQRAARPGRRRHRPRAGTTPCAARRPRAGSHERRWRRPATSPPSRSASGRGARGRPGRRSGGRAARRAVDPPALATTSPARSASSNASGGLSASTVAAPTGSPTASSSTTRRTGAGCDVITSCRRSCNLVAPSNPPVQIHTPPCSANDPRASPARDELTEEQQVAARHLPEAVPRVRVDRRAEHERRAARRRPRGRAGAGRPCVASSSRQRAVIPSGHGTPVRTVATTVARPRAARADQRGRPTVEQMGVVDGDDGGAGAAVALQLLEGALQQGELVAVTVGDRREDGREGAVRNGRERRRRADAMDRQPGRFELFGQLGEHPRLADARLTAEHDAATALDLRPQVSDDRGPARERPPSHGPRARGVHHAGECTDGAATRSPGAHDGLRPGTTITVVDVGCVRRSVDARPTPTPSTTASCPNHALSECSPCTVQRIWGSRAGARYRSTRFTHAVRMTDATIDTSSIIRQPTPPPRGRTSTFRPIRILPGYPTAAVASRTVDGRRARSSASRDSAGGRARGACQGPRRAVGRAGHAGGGRRAGRVPAVGGPRRDAGGAARR